MTLEVEQFWDNLSNENLSQVLLAIGKDLSKMTVDNSNFHMLIEALNEAAKRLK